MARTMPRTSMDPDKRNPNLGVVGIATNSVLKIELPKISVNAINPSFLLRCLLTEA